MSPRSKNDSEELFSFFNNASNNCVKYVENNSNTNYIFEKLYDQIKNGYNYILHVKNQLGIPKFYNSKIKKINKNTRIIKPKKFTSKSFPKEIIEHINVNSVYEISYNFSLFNRNIKIHFITEDPKTEKKINVYNNYVDIMLNWLYITNIYSSEKCSKTLSIFVYLTTLKKSLPKSNTNILDENNVNTAFTMTCIENSEIVIFRKEEWFKVFIHESMHNFGLDFSDMNIEPCKEIILNLFPVKSDVNLYEAYTEFWAEIMNILFFSFFELDNKDDVKHFLNLTEYLINIERSYSFFQMIKVLDFMGLEYKDLYLKGSAKMRENLYKEDTNVLSYYVITCILMDNYQEFINWCYTNNTSLLQFKKTEENQKKFCEFIVDKYISKDFLKSVNCTKKIYTNAHIHYEDHKNKKLKFILNNTRMTIIEIF